MLEFFKEVYYVSWADLRFMRHNILNIMISSLMSPLLYLVAFVLAVSSEDPEMYIAFVIPGIVALSSMTSSFSSTSTRMNVQRLYYRSFDEMMMCPLRPSAIVVGKSILGIIRSLISCSLIFIIGLILTPNLFVSPLFVVSLLISCFSFSLLGEAAALLAKSHQSMATFNSLVILPMSFLCGTFFAVSALPKVFQGMLYLLPLTHSSSCIRAAALGTEFPWWSFGVMIFFCVAVFLLDYYLVVKRKV
ncbi:MAG: ABC transporter permease [Thermoplasmatales archaeon]|jgi:ABC-2 type transport system permease protein|nr:ABC transporter permease [Thermoplasmatales archaeon]